MNTTPHANGHTATVTLSRPPTASEILFDRGFRALTHALAWLSFGLLFFLVYEIGKNALPALSAFGTNIVTSDVWNSTTEEHGILPHIWGTIYSSLISVTVATIFGVAVAIFLTENFLPEAVRGFFKTVIELLAAIPSVIYGLWGIYVVIPAIRPVAEWLGANLGWTFLFSGSFSGPGMLPASIVLAIMLLPTITAISRDALENVPPKLREAALGMGATRWQAIFQVILPTASTGIFGSVILAFGRALGETMALAMLVGNSTVVSWSLLSPGTTLAALMALNFPEASGLQVSALMVAALVLMLITLVVNIVGSLILWQASGKLKGLN